MTDKDKGKSKNPGSLIPRAVIPAEAGIQCLSPIEQKAKTLDPRLKMSRMTEKDKGKRKNPGSLIPCAVIPAEAGIQCLSLQGQMKTQRHWILD